MQSLKNELEALGQGHLLEGFDSLSPEDQKTLLREIKSQDFALLKTLHQEATSGTLLKDATPDVTAPMPFTIAEEDHRHEMWEETGRLLLAQGAVAAFLVAGGQGSRLGFEGPKGAFDIGLPSHKSIFAIQAERLLNLASQAGHAIPWCIMTSPLNHEDTLAHFEAHHYFGYDRSYIRFFSQGMISALDANGKALKSAPGHLALVPDGNGGCFRALAASGTLAWLIEKGIRFVFLYNVDNILVKICDPTFVGALASNGQAQASSKVVHKRNAEEKVGIFALKGKLPTVIEYSDLAENLRTQTLPDGSLAYDGGNIAIHLFRIEALRKLQSTPLPWHAARKKVLDCPHAWKFEQFVFDAFPVLGTMTAFGVEREDEFAPVKNATGADSPATARQMLGLLHREWLHKAGVALAPQTLYEIAPSLSYAGENLSQRVFDRERGKGILEFKV